MKEFAEFRSTEPTRFDQLDRLELELCVTVCLFYMNVARLVALATEKEKPEAADPKNF